MSELEDAVRETASEFRGFFAILFFIVMLSAPVGLAFLATGYMMQIAGETVGFATAVITTPIAMFITGVYLNYVDD